VDDCDDNNASITSCVPNFGFTFNGIKLANTNNGIADPGESASVTFCARGQYSLSDFFFNRQYFVLMLGDQ
jgi:hypothetical protein